MKEQREQSSAFWRSSRMFVRASPHVGSWPVEPAAISLVESGSHARDGLSPPDLIDRTLPNPAYNLERAPLPRICGTAIAEVAGMRGRSISLFKKLVVGFSNRRYVPAAMTRPVASMAAKYAHA